MRRNPNLMAVIGPLNAAGVPYTVVHGRKHHIVRWVAAGHKRMIVASHTSSDHRSDKNNRAFVRRILRKDGMLA